MAAEITMSIVSKEEDYMTLFTKPVGTVVKVLTPDYETVMNRIEEIKPKTTPFELTLITPGTSLYTIYGAEHCIVTLSSTQV